jgi:hypothetical protein
VAADHRGEGVVVAPPGALNQANLRLAPRLGGHRLHIPLNGAAAPILRSAARSRISIGG